MCSAFKSGEALRKPNSRVLQLSFFLAGLFLFAWSVQAVGIQRLGIMAPALWGWGLFFLLIYPFACWWDVLGWQVVFSPESRPKIRHWKLYAVRLAGEAVNNITPFIDIGGEPLKATLVAQIFGIGKKAALASVVIARTMLFFSEVFFWIFGLFLAFVLLPGRGEFALNFSLYACVLVSGGFCAGLFFLQKKGFFLTFVRWIERVGFKPAVFEKFRASLAEADTEIISFYKGGNGRVAACFVFHFIGWAAGGLEIWAISQVMDIPVSLWEGILLEAILQLIRTMTFFIPGNLGAQEAGMGLLAQWMGYHPSVGVALSLLKRFRQVVWTAVGFIVWGFFNR